MSGLAVKLGILYCSVSSRQELLTTSIWLVLPCSLFHLPLLSPIHCQSPSQLLTLPPLAISSPPSLSLSLSQCHVVGLCVVEDCVCVRCYEVVGCIAITTKSAMQAASSIHRSHHLAVSTLTLCQPIPETYTCDSSFAHKSWCQGQVTGMPKSMDASGPSY